MDEAWLVECFNRQLERAAAHPFYRRIWGQDLPRVESVAAFSRVPPVPCGAFAEDAFDTDAPRGAFFNRGVARINLTPSGRGLRPIYFSRHDLAVMRRVNADLLRRAGITEDDVAITTLSYSLLPAGLMIQDAFEELGAKIIPVGPGDSERTVELMKNWKVTVVYGNPSFTIKLAEQGAPPIRVLVAGGEPFSAVPGYKDAVRRALGQDIILIESYGMAESGPIARECRYQNGLHVAEDYVHLEIVDPADGTPLPLGEVGEVVVTHLDKEAMPLVRYRTGDLSALGRVDCPCGRSLTLVGGIRGRADQMKKVKGVKLYPAQVRALLDSLPETRGRAFRLRLQEASAGTAQTLALILEGPPLGQAGLNALQALFRKRILIVPNEVLTQEKLAAGPVWDTHG